MNLKQQNKEMKKTLVLIGHRKSSENTNTRFMVNRLSQKSNFSKIQLRQLDEQDSPIVLGHHANDEYAKNLVQGVDVVVFDCTDEEALNSKNIKLINFLKNQTGIKTAVSVGIGLNPDPKKVSYIKDVIEPLIKGINIIAYSHDDQFGNGVLSLATKHSISY